MKTFIISLMMVAFSSPVNSQILYEENFESLSLGPIVGQGSYSLYGGTAIVTQDGTNKVLSIGGSAVSGLVELGTGNFTEWPNRYPANNIIQVEYDYYTGPTISVSSMGGIEIIIDNEEYVGFLMNIETKTLYGAYHYWGIPVQEIPLGVNNTPIVLPANSWVRLGFSYNTVNRNVTLKGPGFTKVFQTWGNPAFDTVGLAYWRLNNAVAEHVFDNILIKAVEQASLLAVNDNFNSNSAIVLYPNPASDYVNVKSNIRILTAYIYDMNGIRQEVQIQGGRIDVKHLPAGNYLVGLKTEQGFVSRKIIKK